MLKFTLSKKERKPNECTNHVYLKMCVHAWGGGGGGGVKREREMGNMENLIFGFWELWYNLKHKQVQPAYYVGNTT